MMHPNMIQCKCRICADGVYNIDMFNNVDLMDKDKLLKIFDYLNERLKETNYNLK